MKQFYLSDDLLEKDEISISGDQFHYLKNVRRLKEGDRFAGIDSHGNIYNVTIIKEEKKQFFASFSRNQEKQEEKAFSICLYQSLLKGKKFDKVVRQATEAGVDKIIPLLSEHTIVKFSSQKDIDTKISRWEKIITEAVQQSGRHSIPSIVNPVHLKRLGDEKGVKIFFHQEKIDNNNLHFHLSSYPKEINLLIGPEGGFSENEIIFLKEKDFVPVHLGNSVLRAETAAIYALGAVQTILEEKDCWRLI